VQLCNFSVRKGRQITVGESQDKRPREKARAEIRKVVTVYAMKT
jgi:hypothetical protein